jgi:hypothetical protein
MHKTKPYFTHSSLLKRVKSSFEEQPQFLSKEKSISQTDCLMSGLAIFALKYKSLLQYETDKAENSTINHNLQNLYGVSRSPCDTYLRERLDNQDISIIRPAFSSIFALLQRSKELENWKYLEDKFIISLDASGFFSSSKVKCKNCCQKVINKGTDDESTIYHHQMLIGSVVSPSMKQVIPIEFEPIIKEDGDSKNDCERNCAKRWLSLFRKAHPQLSTIIVADGLYSNAPFIRDALEKRCSFILVAKEKDHKYLYDYFRAADEVDAVEFKTKSDKKEQRYRFMNNVPLNDTNHDLKVNVLYFEEYDPKKDKTSKWLWVSDIKITKDNAKFIMKAGRSRWKIENETFNTLKNQGYNFEHNFGHGYNGLSNVFAALMLLAFFIDQVLEAVNLEFQAVLKKYKTRCGAFRNIISRFLIFSISSYERLYYMLVQHPPPSKYVL